MAKFAGRNFAQDWNRQPPDRWTVALLVLRIQFGNVKQYLFYACVLIKSLFEQSKLYLCM